MSGPSENLTPNKPRLEYFLPGSTSPRTVVVENSPFTIGRCSSAGLQLDCSSVSREHAQITASDGRFYLSDLSSMNGSYVNGEPAGDAPLDDGDTIRIADIDLVFVVQPTTDTESMATQPLSHATCPVSAPASHVDAVALNRRHMERLLWVAPTVSWSSISEIETSDPVAYVCGHETQTHGGRTASASHSLIRTQHRSLAWTVAAERLATRGEPADLLLRLTPDESIQERDLFAAEAALHRLRPGSTLGLVVPWEHTTDDPRSMAVCRSVVASGLRLVLDSFTGSASAVESLNELTPDRLFFSRSAVSGVSSEPRRLQLTERVVTRCAELGIQPILPTKIDGSDRAACRDLGVRLEATADADLSQTDKVPTNSKSESGTGRLDANAVKARLKALV